jgi:predicted nucleic acid-binding protein
LLLALHHAFRYQKAASKPLYQAHIRDLHHEINRLRRPSNKLDRLETWLGLILKEYEEHILDFAHDEAQVWGRLRVPHPGNAIDKQIAATALTHDLTLVTRNTHHFEGLALRVLNPFD